jgi:hypothetical protein
MSTQPENHSRANARRLTLLAIPALFAWPLFGQGPAQKPSGGPQFPLRPVLTTGGSNWAQQSGPLTIPTTDLSTGLTPEDLVSALMGSGVTVSNVTYTGLDHTAGTFSGGSGIVGFEAGILLSSGNVATVSGPLNTNDGSTTENNLPGDPELDSLIPGFGTFDATLLEFDFECTEGSQISFQYVFCSEEYNEFVASPFNDVFGFFLNGQNLATLPGGATPVAINNVNCGNPYNPPGGSNCALYRNNDCDDLASPGYPCSQIASEMDGYTTVFSAVGNVMPGVNHIKLAIADAGDMNLDSNVFLRGMSFKCGAPVPVFDPPTPCNTVVSGPYGSPIEFDVIAIATNGFAGQTVALSVTGDSIPLMGGVFNPPLPTGRLQPATTHYSWTPGLADVGDYMLTFTATDQLGATSECMIGISVEEDTTTVDLGCSEFNRYEMLTPGDTFTGLTLAHNPEHSQGFFYVAATDAAGNEIGFDHLIGQLLIIDGFESFEYAVNAVDYRAAVAEGALTDVDSDGVRDLNGTEYEKTAGELLFPRFMGQSSSMLPTPFDSDLIMISLSGGSKFSTTLDFLIYNDNEQVFSAEHTIDCWDRVSLSDISGAFNASFLRNGTDHDPLEILGHDSLEAGWFKMNGAVANSSSASIPDPAVYGVLVERIGASSIGDLPFELCAQDGHLLPRTLGGDNEEVAGADSEDCTVNIRRRRPGSLLLFPEFNNRTGSSTIFSVTNSHPNTEVRVHFVYYGRFGS